MDNKTPNAHKIALERSGEAQNASGFAKTANSTIEWPANEDEAWAMPWGDVMTLPKGVLVYECFAPVSGEMRDELFAKLGKPTGVGLQSGYVGPRGRAIPMLQVMRGDVVLINEVNHRGLRRLKVSRLGRTPDLDWYVRQIPGGMPNIFEWASWTNARGSAVHELEIYWKENPAGSSEFGSAKHPGGGEHD